MLRDDICRVGVIYAIHNVAQGLPPNNRLLDRGCRVNPSRTSSSLFFLLLRLRLLLLPVSRSRTVVAPAWKFIFAIIS